MKDGQRLTKSSTELVGSSPYLGDIDYIPSTLKIELIRSKGTISLIKKAAVKKPVFGYEKAYKKDILQSIVLIDGSEKLLAHYPIYGFVTFK